MTYFNEKIIYVLLFVLTVLSWWLLEYTEVVSNKSTIQSNSPDYFSTGYTKWEMDSKGRPKSKLIAEKMTHILQEWSTFTEKPIIYFYNEKTPPWVILSETGVMSKDNKRLRLNGKVSINREQGENSKPLTINTSNLFVKPDDSYAETVDWAELISQQNVTTGVGMKVFFREPIHLELLSKVKGKYETK